MIHHKARWTKSFLPPEPRTSLESHSERAVVVVISTSWYSRVSLPLFGHEIGPLLLLLLLLNLQLPPAREGDTDPGLALETEGDGGFSLARQEDTVF